jgi:hypothetical protein
LPLKRCHNPHETLPRVFLECLGKDRDTHLRQKLNNTYPLFPTHKEWEAEQVALYFTDSDPDLIPPHGWERAYTDKLGGSQVKATGPKAYTTVGSFYPGRPDWLEEAIRRQVHPYPNFPRSNLALGAAAKHPLVEELFTAPPEDSIDHHLLNKLASFLSERRNHHDP